MKDMSEVLEEFFHKQPYAELSTSDLIKHLYEKEYEKIKAALHDPLSDKEARAVAKRHKGQLHRRLLYHLNRLVDKGTITVSGTKGKGEKCYSLDHRALAGKNNHLPAAPLSQPLDKLERYREQGILHGYDRQGWHHRLTAVLLETKKEETARDLHVRLRAMSKHVNDAIGLRRAQWLLVKEDLSALTALLKQLDIDTRDNGKHISLLIDLEDVHDHKDLEDFLDAFALLEPSNLHVILSMTTHYLDHHQRTLRRIVKSFSQHRLKINLHNKEAHAAPVIVGRAGTYTLAEDEWAAYEQERNEHTVGLCVGQTSAGVDMHRFFETYRNGTEFRRFILKVAKALVESTTLQRRRADIAFEELNKLVGDPHAFFKYSTNHIRLWNYDWEEKEQRHLPELLATTNDDLAQFCKTEETIYKSCGMPIRFKVALASMFSKFEQGYFSRRHYRKLSINGLKALQQEEFRKFISARERIVRELQHNDRVRIFRTTPVDPEEAVKEIRYLLAEYALPHLTYDFAQRRADMSLESFMGGDA